MNEAIVDFDAIIIYIARKLHWSLEEIGELPLKRVNEIMEELQFQEAQEQYRQDHALASVLAAIYNTVPTKSHKTYKPRDFIGAEPQRGKEPHREKEKSLEELAEDKGIKLPQN